MKTVVGPRAKREAAARPVRPCKPHAGRIMVLSAAERAASLKKRRDTIDISERWFCHHCKGSGPKQGRRWIRGDCYGVLEKENLNGRREMWRFGTEKRKCRWKRRNRGGFLGFWLEHLGRWWSAYWEGKGNWFRNWQELGSGEEIKSPVWDTPETPARYSREEMRLRNRAWQGSQSWRRKGLGHQQEMLSEAMRLNKAR